MAAAEAVAVFTARLAYLGQEVVVMAQVVPAQNVMSSKMNENIDNSTTNRNDSISHNGRELELMLSGLKPMASFVAEDLVPPELIGDAEFASYVESGLLIKHVYRNDEFGFEMRSYCLPTEEWRGKLQNLIYQLTWERKIDGIFSREDRERMESFLLGYSKEDTERHLEGVLQHLRVQNP
ncbi:hypothetical protein [Brucella intermedia]|uniref:hypothetical protein n=1 Tax=Brucella intermedia TaxID=94625 RepID=UPI00046AF5E4|nr:hypothetical protein [Brucella intermedia]